MPFRDPPGYAAWQHGGAREGFEVVFVSRDGDGYRLDGEPAAVEDGEAWTVGYAIALGPDWSTRTARISGRSASGPGELILEADGVGGWLIDGEPARQLDGCLDIDLESSALSNAFPVHRLGLEVGEAAEAPAAYVRAAELTVERLEQRYRRLDERRYRYTAPGFGFE